MTLTLFEIFRDTLILFEFGLWPITISLQLQKTIDFAFVFSNGAVGFVLGPIAFDIFIDTDDEEPRCDSCGKPLFREPID